MNIEDIGRFIKLMEKAMEKGIEDLKDIPQIVFTPVCGRCLCPEELCSCVKAE